MTSAKKFDDADQYEREIRILVPGYDALHAMVPAVLGAALPTCRRVLVVGCGPAHEAVTIAHTLTGCTIDAIDPSPAMADAARATVRDAALTERVRVAAASLHDVGEEGAFDAAVATLVGHFVPDDGKRAEFLGDLARSLRPGGIAVLSEFEDVGPARDWVTEAHLRCSQAAGLPAQRATIMRERLSRGFHGLTRARLGELADAVGLSVTGEFFRSFGFVGLVLRKEPHSG
ncbi:MAG: class I SAM-dependent methyltransferase [Myxococcota bacterium]